MYLAILHTLNDNSYTHFIVCYGYNYKTSRFIIGDPAEGIKEYNADTLSRIWKSKLLLTLAPTADLKESGFPLKKDKFSFLKSIISPDSHILFITFILSLATSSLSFAGALFSQRLIDNILPSRNMRTLISFTGLYFVILVISYFLSYLKNTFIIRQTKLFNIRLIHAFLSKVFSFPISFFNSMKTGEIIARMKET